MKKLFIAAIAGLLSGFGSVYAQDSLSVAVADSVFVDTLPDSLSIGKAQRA